MRYRVVVSRVQVTERHVRAVSEDEAIKQIQAELDRPYGFLGSWRTTNTDIDIEEVAAAGAEGYRVPTQGRSTVTGYDVEWPRNSRGASGGFLCRSRTVNYAPTAP